MEDDKLRRLAAATAFVLLLVFIYGHFIEPNRLVVRHLQIDAPRLKKALAGQRLVFVSDLHIPDYPDKRFSKLAETIRELEPDYLLLGGDLVYMRGQPQRVVDWLKDLQSVKKAYAVLGDTDVVGGIRNCIYCHEADSPDPRTDLPVEFLRSDFAIVDGANGPVAFAGADPEWIRVDPFFLKWIPSEIPVILLSHYPDVIETPSVTNVDLVLAGDTHGGQIIAPRFLISALFRPGRGKYLYGWFFKEQTPMYVTSGVGTSIVKFRLGVAPEVVVIDF